MTNIPMEDAAKEMSLAAPPTFAEVYAATFDASVAHLRFRFQMSRDIAEEVVQAEFLKQWESNPGLVGIVNPFKYLRTCIIYGALDYLRMHQKHPLLSAQSLDQPIAEEGGMTVGDAWSLDHQGMSVEDSVLVRDQLRQVAEYLHCLPHIQQVVLQMHAAGYTYAEIRDYLRTHHDFYGSVKAIERRLATSYHTMRQQVRTEREQQRVQRRKRVRKLAIWATQYTACIVCGTTQIPHKAHGKCLHCYDNERMRSIRKAIKSS